MLMMHMLHSLDCDIGDIGVTVRKGEKWFGTIGVPVQLCVCVPEHRIEGKAVIIDNWYGIFRDIPGRFLEKEHEEESRMYSGLLNSMRRAYGEDFNEDEEVTVVVYNRLE